MCSDQLSNRHLQNTSTEGENMGQYKDQVHLKYTRSCSEHVISSLRQIKQKKKKRYEYTYKMYTFMLKQ
jgi:ribosomal protein S8